MTDLAAFKTQLEYTLGTAVDSAIWTDNIKEEALRHALLEYDDYIIYETSFTVTSTGYDQDLSSITALKEILSLAYPWSDGADYQQYTRAWRLIEDQTAYFETIEPQSGDTIRVRHTRLHAIEDLDSATATTVADRHDRIITLMAAIYAITIRIRQLTENPAPPQSAINNLLRLQNTLSDELTPRLNALNQSSLLTWPSIGL